MQQRWRDGLWVGGLALGVSAIALLLLPNARRVALLLGLSAGATAGTTLIRVRAITTHPASPGLNINGQPAIAAPREQSPLSTVLPAPDPEPTTDAASDLFQSTLNQSERVLAWLVQRGIRVKSYYQTEPGDRVFAELALLLGEKYDNAVPFYEQIKRHLSSGHSFQVNLAQKSQQEIADTTQLGHRLAPMPSSPATATTAAPKPSMPHPLVLDKRLIFFLAGGLSASHCSKSRPCSPRISSTSSAYSTRKSRCRTRIPSN
ncbi:MAG: hypothetical protein HC838_05950 [Spirulinaceae cyanobacterium RM2_2_10]|nr:hypothetical protein [Spirulinaceae cyanobacterium RM2_2_10]